MSFMKPEKGGCHPMRVVVFGGRSPLCGREKKNSMAKAFAFFRTSKERKVIPSMATLLRVDQMLQHRIGKISFQRIAW